MRTGVNVVSTAVPTTGPIQVLGPGRDRLLAILSPPSSGRVTYSWRPDVTDAVGITLAPGAAPVQLHRCFVGEVINEPIWAIATVATTVGVVEIVELC
jgi:hypothetical protein